MDSKDFENKISMAWKAHYNGQHEQAIEQFKQLVARPLTMWMRIGG